MRAAEPATVANEFAAVSVSVNWRRGHPQLRIENLQNGESILLDALELASLTRLKHQDLGLFLDPSQNGWRSEEDTSSDEGVWT
jgi:hypothetical protein